MELTRARQLSKKPIVRAVKRFCAITVVLGAVIVAQAAVAQAPTINSIIASFKSAGIPIGKVTVYTAATDENHLLGRPGQYAAKANWVDKRYGSVGSDLGTVEIFRSKADLTARENYVKAIERGNSMIEQYIYPRGFALMRLDYSLTPVQAKQYKTAFDRAVG